MSIISLSSPKSGGKDTVGQLIQMLTNGAGSYYYNPLKLDEWKQGYTPRNDIVPYSWQIKKFASKLKEIASLLTGIPKEDFEKEEVKNSSLGEEWNKWKLEENCAVFPLFNTKEEAERAYAKEMFNYGFSAYFKPKIVDTSLTVRELLQRLGTEAVRENIHRNAWVNATMCNYKAEDKWIITDTRFPNELQAVKDKGGLCIRVDRKSVETGDTHPSETAWRNWNFDYVIDNNGTLDQLVDNVKLFLTYAKLT